MKHFAITLAVILFSTCTLASEADSKAISDLIVKWDAALNRNNLDGLLDLVTEDHERTGPAQPDAQGKEAFAKFCEPYMKGYRFENSRHVIEHAEFAKNWAFVRGSWSGNVVPVSGGAPSVTSAKWMVVAQRQADGTFKVEKGHTFNVEPSLAAVPTN
jgi:uncharacterized protein (TIGR02246 family)